MTVFPEDALIPVLKLIKLWIAEGFVEEVEGASFEETAEAYLEELIDRSLVLISKRGYDGKPKTCTVHDLLRELCLREANTQKFMHLINTCNTALSAEMNVHRRFIFQSMKWEDLKQILKDGVPNKSHSILIHGMSYGLYWSVVPKFGRFKLLRVLDASSVSFKCFGSMRTLESLILLRYLAVGANFGFELYINKFECLQTLILSNAYPKVTSLICESNKIPQIRHLELGSGEIDDDMVLLPNLQTLFGLCPSSCGQKLFGHCPNLLKLGIRYYEDSQGQPNCLESVHLLDNLVALKFQHKGNIPHARAISRKLNLPDVFPLNLKKLSLLKSCLPWKDMIILVRLPNLEVLKLKKHAFVGPDWETTEEGFQALKVLVLESLDLVHWEISSDHFPRLQRLVIRLCNRLEGIPPEIGDILTLQELELDRSNHSVMNSAQEILEQQ